MAAMTHRQILRGRKPQDFIVICIDVDDKYWRDFVDYLMPGHDWQAIRNRGQAPIARGTVESEGYINFVCNCCPEVTSAFQMPLEPNCAYAVVMSHGVTVYQIEAAPEPLQFNGPIH
jgi:hypothetical protein